MNNMEPKLLTLAPYDDPILRSKTNNIQFPLSKEDQHIIDSMLFSIQKEQLIAANASFESAAGMAANQWGINKSIFLYCPSGSETGDIEVVINPSYKPISKDVNKGWEGCFSIPNATGCIQRYKKIKVTYYNTDGEKITKRLSGWEARVWQHENDHLNGSLYDDPSTKQCLEKHCFDSAEELEEFIAKARA